MSDNNVYYGAFDNKAIGQNSDHSGGNGNQAEAGRKNNLRGSSGDGGGSDIETRLSAVEGKIDNLGKEVSGIKTDIAEIKGRLANMPTTWQLIGLIFSVMFGAFALMGGVIAIIRFVLPH